VTQVELLPCPWCGTVPEGCEHRDVTGEGYYGVECRMCRDVFCGAHGDDVAAVHAAWNTRTPSPASPSPVGEGQVVLPRDEIERVIKVLRMTAHPHPSPHADALEAIAAQAPKPASGGGELLRHIPHILGTLRDVIHDAEKGKRPSQFDVDTLCRLHGLIAAEADTAKDEQK